MGASASLTQAALAVDPGSQTSTQVKVRNTGDVVDQLLIDVVGEPSGWATVEPAALNLFPGEEGTALVRFAPPRSSTVNAGDYVFGVRVFSKEDPDGSVVEEGTLDVSAYSDTTAELLPRTSRGRRRATHELAVDNRGNTRMVADVFAEDPDNLLSFDLEPPGIVTEPGAAAFTCLRVRPKKRFMRGTAKTLPFRVIVTNAGEAPVTAEGAMVQEQLLPRWLLPALAALLALLILLWILWLTVFKPSIESAAGEAVQDEIAEVQEDVAGAEAAADRAAGAAEDAAQAAEAVGASPAGDGVPVGEGGAGAGDGAGGAGAGDGAGAGGTGGGGVLGLGPQTDLRIAANADPGSPGTFQDFEFAGQPDDRALLITDIVLQNPRGDSGTIQIRRGDDVLLEVGLGNFRDLDYHFVAPLRFPPGDPVVVAVECLNVGTSCTPAVYFSGVSASPDAPQP